MHHIPSRPPGRVPSLARNNHGLSLIEMLVVVLLLGVMAGMSIGAYSAVHRGIVEKVVNQRNAQEIVSMGVYATMGGAPYIVDGDKAATVQNLIDGTTGSTGTWKGKTFRLTLDPKAVAGALAHVKFEANLLLYAPEGGQAKF